MPLEYGMNAPAKEFDGTNKYIRITDICDETNKYLGQPPVSPDGKLEDKYVVSDDDILFARTGASTGKTYLYSKSDGLLYYAGFLIKAHIKSQFDSYFVFSQTHTSRYRKWVKLMSMRSGQPGINSQEYSSYSFFAPSYDEQRKISNFLKLIDERIDTQSKIIEELELLKRRISNTLFGRSAIDERRLETFYSKGKAGGTPTSTKKEYYGGDIPFLSISDMTEQGKYLYYTEKNLSKSGLENSAAWIVPTNSLILSMYASVGLVAINKVPISTSQAMFSMIIEDHFELEYLYYFLSYFKENKLHRLLETGTQSNINSDMVKSIMVADFGYEENNKIIKILKAYDAKIQIEKDILSAYKKQKAYLLKEMFI